MMEEFNSETDSDYTSYWRDWVGSCTLSLSFPMPRSLRATKSDTLSSYVDLGYHFATEVTVRRVNTRSVPQYTSITPSAVCYPTRKCLTSKPLFITIPTTRAMAESHKRVTRSMAAARKPQPEARRPKPLSKSRRKSTLGGRRRSPVASLPPSFLGSGSVAQYADWDEEAAYLQRDTDSQHVLSPKAGSSIYQIRTEDQVTEPKSPNDQGPDNANRLSQDPTKDWVKDIKQWPPGQRPSLKHHPYDAWNNRPTARYGLGGMHLRPEGEQSPNSLPPSNAADEQVNNSEPVLKLRGGWLDEEDLDSGGSTVAYGSGSIEVTDEASSKADSEAISEQGGFFGDVLTVRHSNSWSPSHY